MFTWLAGCASLDGPYRIDGLRYLLDPQPTVWQDNVFDGAHDPLTTPSQYDTDERPDGSSTSFRFEEVSSGQLGYFSVDGEYASLALGELVLEGGPDRDGWRLVFDGSNEFAVREDQPGGLFVEDFSAVIDRYDLFVRVDRDGLHADGSYEHATESGERQSDEWDGAENGTTELSLGDVFTEDGEYATNRADRDDCDGEACETSAIVYDETFLVTFDGTPLR
ncbi:MAG: hypothetical protein ABMA64_06400 [Myxococcota bacterium]